MGLWVAEGAAVGPARRPRLRQAQLGPSMAPGVRAKCRRRGRCPGGRSSSSLPEMTSRGGCRECGDTGRAPRSPLTHGQRARTRVRRGRRAPTAHECEGVQRGKRAALSALAHRCLHECLIKVNRLRGRKRCVAVVDRKAGQPHAVCSKEDVARVAIRGVRGKVKVAAAPRRHRHVALLEVAKKGQTATQKYT